ncbi:MAG: hypothetical protein BWY92_00699 [Firmicutes bacterium ADurb.BinA052]|nr:MAG: hypothetical protein BWY92_00699 [Firmicutes bacterium ADurb.BinA052]
MGREWLILDTTSKSDSRAALYRVVDTWHIPPPIPGTSSALTMMSASRKPRSGVLGPTTSLKEKTSPGAMMVPSIMAAPSRIFSDRLTLLALNFVVYWPSRRAIPLACSSDVTTAGSTLSTGRSISRVPRASVVLLSLDISPSTSSWRPSEDGSMMTSSSSVMTILASTGWTCTTLARAKTRSRRRCSSTETTRGISKPSRAACRRWTNLAYNRPLRPMLYAALRAASMSTTVPISSGLTRQVSSPSRREIGAVSHLLIWACRCAPASDMVMPPTS